jgi:hypothetical protein
MPLQNRVTPFREIIAASERGLFTGNRGIIHDPAARTLLTRHWATKTWLVCIRDYKGVGRSCFPRRGDGARRRAPALLSLQAGRGGAFSGRVGGRQSRGFSLCRVDRHDLAP